MTGDARLGIWAVPAGALLLLLGLPIVALLAAATPAELAAGVAHPLFGQALVLSAWTSVVTVVIVAVTGTPLAWWMSRSASRTARSIEALVDLPIVLPPAVVGIALLQAFGRSGLLGGSLDALGVSIPFTSLAVIIAQTVVSAPFFVQSATAAFNRVDQDMLLVARTLGESPTGAFARVALPAALPGLGAGALLAWARALGEFGATLLFAGNMPGSTQTMPLAIYTALESDVRAAIALSLVLAAIALVLLLFVRRLLPRRWAQTGGQS